MTTRLLYKTWFAVIIASQLTLIRSSRTVTKIIVSLLDLRQGLLMVRAGIKAAFVISSGIAMAVFIREFCTLINNETVTLGTTWRSGTKHCWTAWCCIGWFLGQLGRTMTRSRITGNGSIGWGRLFCTFVGHRKLAMWWLVALLLRKCRLCRLIYLGLWLLHQTNPFRWRWGAGWRCR